MSDLIARLNKALKSTLIPAPHGSFRHENEESILTAAKKLLIKSETGEELLKFAQDHAIEMHVLRNKQDFGFLPSKSVVYISCPAGVSMPTTRAVIHLAGALRDCMQDLTTDHLRRPDIRQPAEKYSKTYADKKLNQVLWQCAVTHEIFKSTGLLEIVDELRQMGYGKLYEAYKLDLKEEGLE
jgi:hypothetical protein